jgi:Zn-dependent protease with chaperone function
MNSRAVLLLLALLVPLSLACPTPPSCAQEPATGPAPDTVARTSPEAASPAPRDFIAEVRANFTSEARRYARARHALAFVEVGYAVVAAAILLFSGLSARMRDIALSMGASRYLQTLVFAVLAFAAYFVLDFPLSFFDGFWLEHRFGFSNQNFGQWLGDEGKGLILSIALFGLVPVLYLGYGALRRSRRRWWAWLWAGTLPLLLVSVFIEPILIEPVTNKFTPLHDQALRRDIVALAERAGIPGRKVYEVDKSRQTKKYSAYVSGFGASQHIVLWDTTLQGMSHDEILFVVGHEMGHYKLRHIWTRVAFLWVVLGGVFLLLNVTLDRLIARFGVRWRFHGIGDLASLPLLVGAVTVVVFLAQPLLNSYSRAGEHEADAFGLELTRLNEPAASAFLKLGLQNKTDPEPNAFVEAWLYTHPPLVERVRFALGYRPWERGQPAKFFHGSPWGRRGVARRVALPQDGEAPHLAATAGREAREVDAAGQRTPGLVGAVPAHVVATGG